MSNEKLSNDRDERRGRVCYRSSIGWVPANQRPPCYTELVAESQNPPLSKGAVMCSAYWVELNGGNILIVVADSVGDACDKLDSMNFENYSIKHDKTMVALV